MKPMKSMVWSASIVLMWSAQAAAQQTAVSRDALHLLDAVQTAIARHPALEIQKQEVEIGHAVERQVAAAFDQVFETGFNRGRLYSPASSVSGPGLALSPSNTGELVGSYSKLLRNGVAISGALDMQQNASAFVPGYTTSSVRMQLVFPLMRGRGTDVTTSSERAAVRQRDSSVLELRHVTATLVTKVVSSYWALVAAERARAVAAASAERGAKLADNTRALIAADQSPRGDLASVLANAADREAARFVAEQAYVDARQRLLLDMGYRLEDFPDVTGLDDFSMLGAPPDLRDLPENAAEPLVTGALERRADYLAAQTRVDAARIVRDAATNGLLPQIDFSVNAGYTALANSASFSKYLSSVASGVEGPDVFGRISYRFPMQNRQASGRLAEADARLRQATLSQSDLAGTIRASAISSYSALRNSILRLERARVSVEAFQQALQGEQDKLALGVGSIVNLLTIEDRLTASAQREVEAWRSYGQAMVEFRFATGSLMPARDDLPALDVSTFTTVPLALIAGRR